MIWNCCLEAGHGWDGDYFSTGLSYKNMLEYELSHKFVARLSEEMERACLRHKVIDNHTKDVWKNDQIEPNAIYIAVHFHQFESNAVNGSNILYNEHKAAKYLANDLAFICNKWSNATAANSYKCVPKAGRYPFFYKENLSILFNPFNIAGIDAILYYERLEQLATLAAWEITKKATSLNPSALNFCPLSLDAQG